MTDLNTAETTESEVAETPGEETETPEAITLENIKKEYFPPDRLGQGSAMYTAMVAQGISPKLNFDPSEELPAGYGLSVIPLSKRSEGSEGNVRVGVIFAAVPDISAVASHEKGAAFLQETIANYMATRVANAARPRTDGMPSIMPFTIDAFLESRRGRESFKAYSETAGDFVKALKKKGLKFMSPPILRSCLQFNSFAEEKFSNIRSEIWDGIIELMATKAESLGHDASVIRKWKESRYETDMEEVEDFELDDLDL